MWSFEIPEKRVTTPLEQTSWSNHRFFKIKKTLVKERELFLITKILPKCITVNNIKWTFIYKPCYIFGLLPKVLLIGCIVPHGHLLVGENYPKRKRLKNLSDRVLICSRWFTEKKRTKVLPFLVTFYHLGVTQMVWHTQ